MNVQEFYQHALSQRGFTSDAAQQRAVDRLQRAYEEWVHFRAQRSSTFKRLINRPEVPRGGLPVGWRGPRQVVFDGQLLLRSPAGAQNARALP